nr:ribosomal protein S19 family protein [Elusimicrobiota bacterium]
FASVGAAPRRAFANAQAMVGHKLGEFAPTRYFRGHGEAHTKEAAAKT